MNPKENSDKAVSKTQAQTAQVPVKRPPYELWAISAKDSFLALAPEKKWKQEIFHALTILRNNEELQKCDLESIKNAVINVASTGASLNPSYRQAYLIPRKGKCCLDFSYIGLAKLATDSGAVLKLDAYVVHEKDRKFDYWYGLNPDIIHLPSLEQDQGAMTHVYAVADLKNGLKQFIVLTKAEVEKVRMSSQAPNSPMWKSWPEEGARKTAVKKLYKLLPQTEQMSEAISLLNEHEGIDFDAKQPSKLEERLGQDIEKSSGYAGLSIMKEEKPEPEKVVEGVVISDKEADEIRQHEMREAGLSEPTTKDKPYIKPAQHGNTVDAKEGKLF